MSSNQYLIYAHEYTAHPSILTFIHSKLTDEEGSSVVFVQTLAILTIGTSEGV